VSYPYLELRDRFPYPFQLRTIACKYQLTPFFLGY